MSQYEALITIHEVYKVEIEADSLEEANRIADDWDYFPPAYLETEYAEVEDVYEVV